MRSRPGQHVLRDLGERARRFAVDHRHPVALDSFIIGRKPTVVAEIEEVAGHRQPASPSFDHLVGAGEQRRYRAAFLNHALATS